MCKGTLFSSFLAAIFLFFHKGIPQLEEMAMA
jgi:hypothetical protein